MDQHFLAYQMLNCLFTRQEIIDSVTVRDEIDQDLLTFKHA